MPGWRVAAFTVLVGTTVAMACRYTVRELGFVNLEGQPWTLVQFVTDPSSSPTPLPNDSNVAAVQISPEDDPNHPAVLAAGEETRAVLLDGKGRALAMRTTDPISEALHSPLRSQLANESLESFAFVLVKPGSDETENARAREMAATAEAKLAALAPHLPRPVAHPLRVIELTPEQVERERVTLWSLGLDEIDGAALSIIYGRGRRAGPPIHSTFDDAELATQLALVGESCECETDRAWLLEPTIPMQWPDAAALEAPGVLGFDPASPMVHAEVRRILARGDFGIGRGTNADGNRPKDLTEIVFGYTEVSLDDPLPDTTPAPLAPTAAGPPPPSVQIRRGDDWGFEETEQTADDEENALSPTIVATLIVITLSVAAALVLLRR